MFQVIGRSVQNDSATLERGHQRVKIQNIFWESMAPDPSRNLRHRRSPLVHMMPRYQLGRVKNPKSGVWCKVGMSDKRFVYFSPKTDIRISITVHCSSNTYSVRHNLPVTSESKQSAHLLFCQGRILLYFPMLNKY